MGLSGRRLTLLLACALGVLVVIGAAAAFGVGRAQRLASETTGSSSAQTPSPSSGAGSASGPVGTPASREPVSGATPPPNTPPPSPSAGSASPSRTRTSLQPVSVTVSARAAASPHAQEIVGLLQRYFTAINRHDYDAWLATVSTSQAKQTYEKWSKGYETTRDSDIYVSDINPGKPLTVRMQFVSHQSVKDAPSALPEPCVRWDVTYQIVDEGTGLRVGNSAESPSMAPCT